MIKQWVSENGIDSFLEATYLGVPVSARGEERFIYVNPSAYHYLHGKVVIISSPDYPEERIKWLLDEGIKVIFRNVNSFSEPDPYILRIEFGVMWNGDTLRCPEKLSFSEVLDFLKKSCEVEPVGTGNPMRMFLPKIYGIPEDYLLDSDGNLTILGWAMHQVGINMGNQFAYQDLDLYKTGKILPGSL
jgi:hypothetical protein